jgi:hypothetical protein
MQRSLARRFITLAVDDSSENVGIVAREARQFLMPAISKTSHQSSWH